MADRPTHIEDENHEQLYWYRRISRGEVLTDEELSRALGAAIRENTPYGLATKASKLAVWEAIHHRLNGTYEAYAARIRNLNLRG